MKPKPEDVILQEMNLRSTYAELRLIDAQLRRYTERQLAEDLERIKLERWFIEHGLPIPTNL